MTQEQLEGNILIDKFMGLKQRTEAAWHSDWTDLMSVIDKIHSIGETKSVGDDSNENYHVIITKRLTKVVYDWNSYMFSPEEFIESEEKFKLFDKSNKDYRFCLFNESPIYATWTAIVDFIKWYNEKHNKQ